MSPGRGPIQGNFDIPRGWGVQISGEQSAKYMKFKTITIQVEANYLELHNAPRIRGSPPFVN